MGCGRTRESKLQARDDVTCLGPQSPFAAHGVYVGLETMSREHQSNKDLCILS